ncbi:DEAD/DEAH box helicase [Acidaminococcus timonensis]|uniref:DEAD/DEAH box helicase n=1 Tax=Acidaminococcus timonensis TaxID=1871002 RepID=UPI000978F432|nr:DEAD/DEAH box helicase [Acidaminococcus timonensis]
MELRPYQKDLVNKIRQAICEGCHRVCAVLGCGGGKSVIIATIAKAATDKGNRVLFLVHRKELVNQIKRTMDRQGVNPFLCSVSMVQTVSRMKTLARTTPPSLIIVDEAHHALAAGYLRIFDYFPQATVVGFTATPQRMGTGGLGKVFQQLAESVSTKWLIQNHYLAPYHLYSVPLTDVKGIRTSHGDYDQKEIAKLMDKGTIFGDTVASWLQQAKGKKTIVYCASIKTSRATAEAFQSHGIPAAHLDGETPKAERDRIVQEFREGKILVLCNVDLFGEGFDVPDCEAVQLLRPTKSLTLFIQQAMRPMRINPADPNKEAIILDHVGNYTRHGFPDDDHDWSLAEKKKKKKAETTTRQCPICYHVFIPAPGLGQIKCPFCGHLFEDERAPRAEQEELDGVTLEEIKESPYSDYRKATTWQQLEFFRKGKHYKLGWSLHKALELHIPIPSKYQYAASKMGIHTGNWFNNARGRQQG